MPIFSLARLALHLFVGLWKVAALFPFLGAAGREQRIQRWSRQLVAICGVSVKVDDSLQATPVSPAAMARFNASVAYAKSQLQAAALMRSAGAAPLSVSTRSVAAAGNKHREGVPCRSLRAGRIKWAGHRERGYGRHQLLTLCHVQAAPHPRL